MQDNFSFDDQFRDRLDRAEIAPPPMVWENIAAELARQNRRKMLGFWLGGGLAAVGVLAAAWFFYAPDISQKLAQSSGDSTEQKTAPAEGLATADIPSEKKRSSSLGENPTEISAQNQSGISTEKAAGNLEKAASETAFSKKDGIAFSQKSPTKTASVKPSLIEKNGANLGNFRAQNLTGEFPKPSEISSQTIENQLVVNAGKSQKEADNALFILKKETGTIVQSRVGLTNFGQIAGREFSVLKNKKSAKQPPMKKYRSKKRKPVCPSFADRGEVFFLDFYAGPGLAFHTLSPRDGDTPGFSKLRNETEKSKFAWTAGARAGWLIGGKFLLRSGLQYTEAIEKVEFYDPRWKKTVHTTYPNGQTTTEISYGEHFVERSNFVHFLDLPLTFGIEQGRGRLGWSVNSGVAANLLFIKNGKLIDTSAPKETKPRKPTMKVNAGLSLVANGQFFYQIDKKSRVFIEPSYQRILKPVSRKSQPTEERYSFGGLSFGYTRLLK